MENGEIIIYPRVKKKAMAHSILLTIIINIMVMPMVITDNSNKSSDIVFFIEIIVSIILSILICICFYIMLSCFYQQQINHESKEIIENKLLYERDKIIVKPMKKLEFTSNKNRETVFTAKLNYDDNVVIEIEDKEYFTKVCYEVITIEQLLNRYYIILK